MSFTAFDPHTGKPWSTTFEEARREDIAAAVDRAQTAFLESKELPPRRLAEALRAIAQELEEAGAAIIDAAERETALGRPRLQGELTRTTNQFHVFADLCEEGAHLEAVIDHARPDLTPPTPDLRRMQVPLGPVAVFGASNFPLAFSVAGGDTAAALAAGCPVIVKGHPSHPETSLLSGKAIERGLTAAGAPAGFFGVLQGRSNELGAALVTAAGIQAVAFTGSEAGGRALYDLAGTRPQPIPVYAEMGSVNPVFLTASALAVRGSEIAAGYVQSLTLGTGQFCTKPGLVFVPDLPAGRRWEVQIADNARAAQHGPLLNRRIWQVLRDQVAQSRALGGVEVLVGGDHDPSPGYNHPTTVFAVDARTFLARTELQREYFGPVGVVVRYSSLEQLGRLAANLPGSLTGTIHAEPEDMEGLRPLIHALTLRAGRLVWNGYPTGVPVTRATVHGGPYPATTIPLHTSVGTAAIKRFFRPVAYQGYPASLLPPALHDDNPFGLLRLVDGHWQT